MPVRSFVSPAVAKDARETPMRLFTVWLTSSRFEDCTRQAQWAFAPRVDATMMVLALVSVGYPYFWQNSVVSAKLGSHGTISKSTASTDSDAATMGWTCPSLNSVVTVASCCTNSRNYSKRGEL